MSQDIQRSIPIPHGATLKGKLWRESFNVKGSEA